MMPLFKLLLALATTLTVVHVASAWNLVEDGETRAQIVVAADAPRLTQLAATELQEVIEEISGAVLPIRNNPGDDLPYTVYVGASRWTEALGVDADDLQHAAYRIQPGDNYLILLGSDRDYQHQALTDEEWDKATGSYWRNPGKDENGLRNKELGIWLYDEGGTLNAVYAYLRSLGVRWFMSGELGTVIPELASIPAAVDAETVRPDYPLRCWLWHGRRFTNYPAELILHEKRIGADSRYSILGDGPMTHGLRNVLNRSEMREAHPEYYALNNGERMNGPHDKPHACLSSDALVDEAAAYVRALYDLYDMPLVQLSPEDGFRQCQCEACSALSPSDNVFLFLNKVARELYRTHPERILLGAAYSSYREPPQAIDQFSPNFAVSINNVGRPRMLDEERWADYQQLVRAWQEKLAPQRIIRVENTLYGARPYPVIHPHAIARDLRAMQDISLGERNELRVNRDFPASTHLNQYVMARLYWDADLDIDELLDDYYTTFYGPAATEMQTTIESAETRLANSNARKGTMDQRAIADFIDGLLAAREAAPESPYRDRIDLLIAEIVPGIEPETDPSPAPIAADYAATLRLQADLIERRAEANSFKWWNFDSGKWREAREQFVIDGALEEAFWQRTGAFRDDAGAVTRFQIMLAEDALYVGITCQPGADNAENERVRVLLETDAHSFYELEVSPSGTVTSRDLSPGDSSVGEDWDGLAEVATLTTADSWSIEMRIPLVRENGDPYHEVNYWHRPSDDFPWHFNIIRERTIKGVPHISSFNPAQEDIFDPSTFGRLVR